MYTITETFLITRKVELVGNKEIITVILDADNKIFVVYIVFFAGFDISLEIDIFCMVQIAFLKADETPTLISSKYTNFADIISKNLIAQLLEYTRINNTINLVEDQKPFYKPIYSLGLLKLETLKIYIKTNLANVFIRLSKSPAGIFISFIREPDNILWL